MTEKYPGFFGEIVVNAGDACQVMLGSDIVINGKIDRYTPSVSGEGKHEVRISGRGLCRNLTDCSAVLPGGNNQISAKDAVALATQLTIPFNIPVVYKGGGVLKPIPGFTVNLGETPYEIIEKVCRYSALLCYEDFDGSLVLSGVGSTTMASGFAEGPTGNVETGSAMNSADMRYSQYIVVFESADTLRTATQAGSSGIVSSGNQKGLAYDQGVREYRPLIIVSQQNSLEFNFAQALAEWHAARNWGRSQQVRVTVPTWRDIAGVLWTPNALASIDCPYLKVAGVQWIIASVEFHSPGTRADITLMPKEAFIPETTILQNYARPVAGQTAYTGQEKSS